MIKLFKKNIFLKSLPGFSLLEVSIVFIIVGIMATGVMKGKELIKSARLQSVASQVRAYQSAVTVFRHTYSALPGDYDRATTSLSAECINGDGDGIISESESILFWEHLLAAGYIDGLTKERKNRFGYSLPSSKLGGGFTVSYRPYPDLEGHWLVLSKSVDRTQPLLTPQEAKKVCGLFDVQVSTEGHVRAKDAPGMAGKCLDRNGYFSFSQTPACIMYFKIDD